MMSDEQIAHLGRRSTEFNVGEQVPGTRYLVVSRIGQGGMGSVYEVEHRELGKRFVLKALLDQFCQREDLVQRLRNEWRSLGRLEHPNIVSVSDAGIAANGVPFYVMERLHGESLAGALGRLGRLSLLDSIRLAAEVLEGLAAAHDIGIVHRDVKPPNIFITHKGSAKLLDFGIAKLTDGAALELTGRGIAIGTPRYMSPEQAAGEKVDGRADLYAVGLVLFEMLSGNGPFDGCESHEVFLAHITRPPPRLSDLMEGIPPELDALVGSLLAKRPEERPQTAATAAAALRSLLGTYRALEHVPDPQAEQWDGALTPFVHSEFVLPMTPGHAAVLGVESSSVSGSGSTAAEHFRTPPFIMRGSTPPGPERARSIPPPFGAVQSRDLAGPQTHSTGAVHPGPLGRAENTPSGVSRSTSPGALALVPPVYARAPRRFPLWAAIGVAFGAVVSAAWLGGKRAPEVPQPNGDPPASARNALLDGPTSDATAAVPIQKPETPSEAVLAEEAAAVGGSEPESLTRATSTKKAKVKRRDVDPVAAREPAVDVTEPPPAGPSTPVRDTATPEDKPKAPLPIPTNVSDRPSLTPKKPSRLPSSGIGGL